MITRSGWRNSYFRWGTKRARNFCKISTQYMMYGKVIDRQFILLVVTDSYSLDRLQSCTIPYVPRQCDRRENFATKIYPETITIYISIDGIIDRSPLTLIVRIPVLRFCLIRKATFLFTFIVMPCSSSSMNWMFITTVLTSLLNLHRICILCNSFASSGLLRFCILRPRSN